MDATSVFGAYTGHCGFGPRHRDPYRELRGPPTHIRPGVALTCAAMGTRASYADPMAGRTRLLLAIVALAIAFAACSDGEDGLGAELESAQNSTTTTTEATTTTTEATTTTLSEQAKAEADVAQLVTDYWLTEIDTSKGEVGLEFMTGLIKLRTQQWAEGLTEGGETLRDFAGQKRIEIQRVDVDLESGTGEVTACMGSGSEVLDLETLERVEIGSDPDFLSTSVLLVELTSQGWKINEMFASAATGSPELCELEQ